MKILRRVFVRDSAMAAWTVWSAGFVVSVWVYSLTESVLLSYNTLTWVLFIVLVERL